MNQPERPDQQSAVEVRTRVGCQAVSLWGVLIVVSLVLEPWLNPSPLPGTGGMGPIPGLFLSALGLGWISGLLYFLSKR